jgi:hypothetical protein
MDSQGHGQGVWNYGQLPTHSTYAPDGSLNSAGHGRRSSIYRAQNSTLFPRKRSQTGTSEDSLNLKVELRAGVWSASEEMRRNKAGDIRPTLSLLDNESSAARSETHGMRAGDFQPGQWTGSGLADLLGEQR